MTSTQTSTTKTRSTYTPDMKRRLINMKAAQGELSATLAGAHSGEHCVINRKSVMGYVVLVDDAFYRQGRRALGAPIEDWSDPASTDYPHRFVTAEDLRKALSATFRRAHEGEHQVINRHGTVAYAIAVDKGSYVRMLEALGEPIPEWAATDE